ncbi:MAG: hypothetical protein L6R39_007433, partial [Caloplaca ligustica]
YYQRNPDIHHHNGENVTSIFLRGYAKRGAEDLAAGSVPKACRGLSLEAICASGPLVVD